VLASAPAWINAALRNCDAGVINPENQILTQPPEGGLSMKLKLLLPVSAALLCLVSVAGYGMTANDLNPNDRAVSILENKLAVSEVPSYREASDLDERKNSGTEKAPAKNKPITYEDPNLLTASLEFDRELADQFGLEGQMVDFDSPANVSPVSQWLKARANKEAAFRAASTRNSVTEAALAVDDAFGGGWCDLCGCWMRHGCDPNGNCQISHLVVCGPESCSLHSGTACYQTGGAN
jgi:hypothetical protein